MTVKGRPSKCTPQTIEAVAEGVRGGLSLTSACARVGIGSATCSAWLHGKLMRHRRFQSAVKKAQADREAELVERLKQLQLSERESVALDATKFELERRHRWTLKQALEVSGPDSGPVRVEVSPLAALVAVAGAAAEPEWQDEDEGAEDGEGEP